MSDPFADVEEDDPQGGGVAVAVAPDAAKKVRVTLKGGAGHSDPWITIDGASIADALSQLRDANVLKDLVDETAKVGKYFASTGSPSREYSGSNKGGNGYKKKDQPSQSKEAPDGKTMHCSHGQRTYETGLKRNGPNAGSAWHAFDCPEGICDREWYNPKS